MTNDVLNELKQTTHDLMETIMLYKEDEFNVIPFQYSWTAAQVIQHLLKSEYAIVKTLQGSAVLTQREPSEKVDIIKSIFLDFNIKMKSPEFTIPPNNKEKKQRMYEALKSQRYKTNEIASSLDLSMTFTDFPFPTLGNITGIEWITFIICHSKRHIEQLNKIYKKIISNN